MPALQCKQVRRTHFFPAHEALLGGVAGGRARQRQLHRGGVRLLLSPVEGVELFHREQVLVWVVCRTLRLGDKPSEERAFDRLGLDPLGNRLGRFVQVEEHRHDLRVRNQVRALLGELGTLDLEAVVVPFCGAEIHRRCVRVSRANERTDGSVLKKSC